MLWMLLLACGASPDAESADACTDAPVVTYETFGAGFLIQYCQSCHASTAPDRAGAPADVVFDTADDAWTWRERILERAASEPPTMPPLGGTTEDDRARLRTWLDCAPEGT